ncbi:MAG: FeoA family protein [Flavobacteriales bacterium]
MRISDLKKGQCGTIKGFFAGDLPEKFYEMGLLPGIRVELYNDSWSKDPLYLKMEGCALAIRKAEADKIEVELEK